MQTHKKKLLCEDKRSDVGFSQISKGCTFCGFKGCIYVHKLTQRGLFWHILLKKSLQWVPSNDFRLFRNEIAVKMGSGDEHHFSIGAQYK